MAVYFRKMIFRILLINIVNIFCPYVQCSLIAMRKGCFSKQVMLAIILMAWAAPLRAEFVYVVNELGTGGYVSAFSIDPTTGALTSVPGSPFAAGSVPVSVAVDPFVKFAYVANEHDNDISAYNINSATGSSDARSGFAIPNGTVPAVSYRGSYW